MIYSLKKINTSNFSKYPAGLKIIWHIWIWALLKKKISSWIKSQTMSSSHIKWKIKFKMNCNDTWGGVVVVYFFCTYTNTTQGWIWVDPINTLLYNFIHYHDSELMLFTAKYWLHPGGSHEVKILSNLELQAH